MMRAMTGTVAAPPAVDHLPAATFFENVRYVTLKVTNGCNLKCTYCNVEADLPSTPRLGIETYKRVAKLLIENSRFPAVGLEFHGGEPLLQPHAWYEEAVGYAAALARAHDKTVTHPLQTNGTLLTDERIDQLTALGIDVGISFDGPPHINDEFRMAGRAVERSIRRLREHGKHFGMILVLSRSNCERMDEVMDYFRDIGVSSFRVNFLQPQGRGMTHILLAGDEMFRGMKAVFEHMHATKCSVVEADMETAIQRFMIGRDPQPSLSCWEFQCQAGRVYVAMDHRGAIYACGTDMSQHQLGHIDRGFSPSHVKATLDRLHQKDAWYVRCFDCNARRICNQSCPTSDYNDLEYRERECSYTKMLYQYLADNEDRVREVHGVLLALRPGGARS